VAAALLEATCEGVDTCADVRDLIDRAVVEDPPQTVTEGGVIREGFDEDLDTLRETAEAGREWIDDLEARERERTGIDSLSVGYTEVHGYYIEVTDPNLDRVPDDYQRRQTLKNAERFVTPDLKQREEEILSAGERADEHEYDLFREVRTAVADETERLRELADALADIDAVAGLAETAVERDYVRPTVDPDLDGPRIAAARHPVVETTTRFVPNDADLTAADVTLLTGPNMSGKSTFMRSVALVQILAQAGSFVPADAARLPVVDRVFTRVGASDDIAGGESTFMREMRELATVLHAATPDSLVLLDEVGRGTSTADGRAIARAAIEYLHDDARATTLFATHYHDLTADAERLPRARNLHFAAERDGDDLTFLHAVADGPAEGSYGVGVARMAGLPEPVIERAAADASDGIDADQPDGTAAPDDGAEDGSGPDVTPDDAAAVVETLRELSVADTTPLEALETLHDLKERVE
jgi:DNA mismatch repair protein MutS